MSTSALLLVVILLTAFGHFLGRKKSLALSRVNHKNKRLPALPEQYGTLVAIWCALPALALFALWSIFDGQIIRGYVQEHLPSSYQAENQARVGLLLERIASAADNNDLDSLEDEQLKQSASLHQQLQQKSQWLKSALVIAIALVGAFIGFKQVLPHVRARDRVETVIRISMIACACIAIVTTVGIVLSVLFEAFRFFQHVSIFEFLFGTHWSPQTAIREDQVGGSGAFGSIPLFAGTMLISAIALFVAVPVGLMSAIYLAEYASEQVRAIAKPVLEILAGIPTVVYGFFAALTVAPVIRNLGESIGLSVSSESALAAGLVMGIMLIPFVSSLSDDVINAVPQSLRDGALGLGATRSETIKQVIIPAALPGIVGSVLLATSRAIGETMIVVMAAGLSAKLTANPLEAVTTVTVQIVTLLTGDQEFDSPKTLAAFALGLTLFVLTLILNVIALAVVRKYREQYE